jgi:hypothetical protein
MNDEQKLKDKMSHEDDMKKDDPKFIKCYEVAYQMGHSAGLAEVECYFHDLVELAKI